MPFDPTAARSVTRTFLSPMETLVLENARGTIVGVQHGCLWITQEGDTRDIVLTDGMRFEITRRGRTVIVAEEASRLRVVEAQSFTNRLRGRLQRALAAWRSRPGRRGRRIAPYF
jgi:hypothetical protein